MKEKKPVLRKVIKTLLLSVVLLSFVGIAKAQIILGTGLLSVTFDEKTVIQFYNNPADKTPAKILEFFDDKSISNLNIKILKRRNYG